MARALDVVGERWALLIIRELLLGPKRFTDLRIALPGASPNALSQRLGELTDAGVVAHRRHPGPAGIGLYALTAWGQQLEPIVLALGTWGLATSPRDEQTFVSLDSLMLTIRTYWAPPPDDLPIRPTRVLVRITDTARTREFGVTLGPASAAVTYELPTRADATLDADTDTLLTVFDNRDLDLPAPPHLIIGGDRDTATRLLRHVHVPAAPQ